MAGPVHKDFSDSGLSGPGLGYVPAPSDAQDQESGIAQPGQLHPGKADPLALRIKHNTETDGFNSIDQAADKFAIRSFLVPDLHTHQILPPDPNRKIARIQCNEFSGSPNGIFVGSLTVLEAIAGTQGGGFAALPGAWLIQVSSSVPNVFEYSSKQPLYYIAATTSDPGNLFVQCFSEMFDNGTPIT